MTTATKQRTQEQAADRVLFLRELAAMLSAAPIFPPEKKTWIHRAHRQHIWRMSVLVSLIAAHRSLRDIHIEMLVKPIIRHSVNTARTKHKRYMRRDNRFRLEIRGRWGDIGPSPETHNIIGMPERINVERVPIGDNTFFKYAPGNRPIVLK